MKLQNIALPARFRKISDSPDSSVLESIHDEDVQNEKSRVAEYFSQPSDINNGSKCVVAVQVFCIYEYEFQNSLF